MSWKRFTDEEAAAFYRRFGQNIHYLRKQKAMSQDELAERVDCSQKYISKIELGQAKPSTVLCSRIAAALQCSADTLFTDALSSEQAENFIVSASERMLTDEVLRSRRIFAKKEIAVFRRTPLFLTLIFLFPYQTHNAEQEFLLFI